MLFVAAAGVTAGFAIPAFATNVSEHPAEAARAGVPHPRESGRATAHDFGLEQSMRSYREALADQEASSTGSAEDDTSDGGQDEQVLSADSDEREREGAERRANRDGNRERSGRRSGKDTHLPLHLRRVHGIDVSSYQTEVAWKYWRQQGKRFAFIKATEGTNYVSETYRSQWRDSRRAGLLRGAYHFALPDGPSGAAQARFFVANGGGGKGDGWTLPGVLDIEFGEAVGRATCYNRSADQIVGWIRDFTTTYQKLTGRTPIIYSNATWWEQCTGNSTAFRGLPLWIASYNPVPGDPPGGWDDHMIWQYTDTPIDQNVFKGTYADLKRLAHR